MSSYPAGTYELLITVESRYSESSMTYEIQLTDPCPTAEIQFNSETFDADLEYTLESSPKSFQHYHVLVDSVLTSDSLCGGLIYEI